MAKHKIKKILSGVQAIGEAPCDDCEHAQQCADKRLACGVFASWTDDGVILGGERNPTRRTYNAVYYGSADQAWEESPAITMTEAPSDRIQITIRRKTA